MCQDAHFPTLRICITSLLHHLQAPKEVDLVLLQKQDMYRLLKIDSFEGNLDLLFPSSLKTISSFLP